MREISILLVMVSLIVTISACTNINHDGTGTNVELNEGKRWKANEATNVGIANMQKIVTSASETEQPDLAEISSALKTEFDLIFKNCTMTGPGHDQLHNYLLPMLGWMRRMKEGTSEESEKAFEEISDHLFTYSDYFE